MADKFKFGIVSIKDKVNFGFRSQSIVGINCPDINRMLSFAESLGGDMEVPVFAAFQSRIFPVIKLDKNLL